MLQVAQGRVGAIHASMLHGVPTAEVERLLGWLTHIAVALEGSPRGSQEAERLA